MAFLEDNNLTEKNSKAFRFVALLAVLIILFGGLGVYYFAKPKHEQEIIPPDGLEDEVRTLIAKDAGTREVEEIRFYNCERVELDGRVFDQKPYSVMVRLKPKPFDENKPLDINREWKIFVYQEDGKWKLFPIRRLAIPRTTPVTDPCVAKY